MRPSVEVVAAVIRGDDGRILICLRPEHLDQGGLWEFPGGKREPGESRFDALSRELREELNIEVGRALPLLRLAHAYPHKRVDLDVWEVLAFGGQPQGMEGQEVRWVSASSLDNYDFPAANATLVCAAQLPRAVLALPDLALATSAGLRQLERWVQCGITCFLVTTAQYENAARVIQDTSVKLVIVKHLGDAISTGDLPSPFFAGVRSPGRSLGCKSLSAILCNSQPEVRVAADALPDLLVIGADYAFDGGAKGDAAAWHTLGAMVIDTKLPAYVLGRLEPSHLEMSIASGYQGIVLDERYWSSDPGRIADEIKRALGAATMTGRHSI